MKMLKIFNMDCESADGATCYINPKFITKVRPFYHSDKNGMAIEIEMSGSGFVNADVEDTWGIWDKKDSYPKKLFLEDQADILCQHIFTLMGE